MSSRQPLLYCIIIEANSLNFIEICGIDVRVIYNKEISLDDVESNIGEEKLYSYGQKFRFKGKMVSAIVTYSEGGGINSTILKPCLEHIDEFEVYDRILAKPTLILDRHRSSF